MCDLDRNTVLKRGLATANFCLWAIGGALLVVGLWLIINESSYNKQNALEQVVPGTKIVTYGLYIFIAAGSVVVFGIASIGCCVATRNKLYPVVIFILLVCVTAAGVLIGCILTGMARGSLLSNVDLPQALYREIRLNFTYVDVNVKFSTLQYTFKCCGILSPKDYRDSEWGNTSSQYLPPTCCTIPISSQYILEPPDNYTACITEAKSDDMREYRYFYPDGCMTTMKNWFSNNTSLLIGLGVMFCVLAALSVTLSAFLCQHSPCSTETHSSTNDQ